MAKARGKAPKRGPRPTPDPALPAVQGGQEASNTTGHTTTAPKLSDAPVGTLVAMPHGGALRNGGTNKGGPGRPRDQIRADALEALTKGPGKLAQILDGVSYTIHVGKCEKCGHLHTASATATPVEVKPADVVKAALALDKLAGEDAINAVFLMKLLEATREEAKRVLPEPHQTAFIEACHLRHAQLLAEAGRL